MKSRVIMVSLILVFAVHKLEASPAKPENLSDELAVKSVVMPLHKASAKKPAASTIEYPGNTWGLVGALSPMERDNIFSQFHMEQGVAIVKLQNYYLIPGMAVDVSRDSRGYDWNNKVSANFGPKLVRIFNRGIVRVGAAFVNEYRTTTGNSASGLMTSMDYWFGWGQPSSSPDMKSPLFPGSTWGIVGNLSPFEKGNTLASADLTQGVNVYQRGKLSVIPFVKLQLGADSKGYDWNNKVLAGSGVKLAYTRKNGSIDLALLYLTEKRMRESKKKADMLSVYGSYWFGWSPKGNREVR